MKITKVTASYGRTVNTGNFNSLRVEATFEAVLEDGETPQEVQELVMTMAKQSVKDQVWRDRDTYQNDWPPSAGRS